MRVKIGHQWFEALPGQPIMVQLTSDDRQRISMGGGGSSPEGDDLYAAFHKDDQLNEAETKAWITADSGDASNYLGLGYLIREIEEQKKRVKEFGAAYNREVQKVHELTVRISEKDTIQRSIAQVMHGDDCDGGLAQLGAILASVEFTEMCIGNSIALCSEIIDKPGTYHSETFKLAEEIRNVLSGAIFDEPEVKEEPS